MKLKGFNIDMDINVYQRVDRSHTMDTSMNISELPIDGITQKGDKFSIIV